MLVLHQAGKGTDVADDQLDRVLCDGRFQRCWIDTWPFISWCALNPGTDSTERTGDTRKGGAR
jgi:hypothetical protein